MSKKYTVILVIIIALILACAACTSNPANSNPTESQSDSGVNASPSSDKTYQSVLDDYTKKLQDATPGLIEEYNAEAATNQGGLEGLANIANAKVSELATICNDGVNEMAQLMLSTGSGKSDEYEEWAAKLQNVYNNEAQKIMDNYTNSAT